MAMSPDDIRDAQRASWDRFSPGWGKWDHMVISMLGPVGEVMIEQIGVRDGIAHLDVAAGTGEPGLTIAGLAPKGKITITDLAPGMLDVAKKNAAGRGITNVEFREADAGNLPFDDATFDSLTCRFGFMFFPDTAQAAREFARVLRPGGRVAASVWVEPADNPWIVIPMGAVAAEVDMPAPPPDAPGMFRCNAPGYLAKLFEAAGLRDITEHEVHGTQRSESPEQSWQMITEVAAPIAGAIERADVAAQARIKASVIEKLQAFAGPDGVSVPHHSRVTAATRAG